MTYAILFPGQGAQFVGMGAELFDGSPELLGGVADSILGWSLKDMCLTGPIENLTRTEHAQPSLYALAYAQWKLFSDRVGVAPACAAGHSLGEYTALAAAGSFSFEDGLKLVAERGSAMAKAADAEPSAMAALIGADVPTAEQICGDRRDEGGRLWVANLNAPGQVVIAGSNADIDWVVANGKQLGVRRAIRLNVAGAFHTPFMAAAADRLQEAVNSVELSEPQLPVFANATAQPVRGDIGANLVGQMTSPVRFAESLVNMAESGVDTFVHVGPGDVTAGMVKRTVPDATVLVVNDAESLDTAVASLAS